MVGSVPFCFRQLLWSLSFFSGSLWFQGVACHNENWPSCFMPDLCGAVLFAVGLGVSFCSSPSLTLSCFTIYMLHEWFSGRILAWHVGDRGSIPRSYIWLLAVRLRRAGFMFSSSDSKRAWQQGSGEAPLFSATLFTLTMPGPSK